MEMFFKNFLENILDQIVIYWRGNLEGNINKGRKIN